MKGDLTQGPVMKTMLRFAVPMILGNLLQQCYNCLLYTSGKRGRTGGLFGRKQGGRAMKQRKVALAKGRLADKAIALFEKAGYDVSGLVEDSRMLIFQNKELSFLMVKPTDVPVYVEPVSYTHLQL